MSQNVPLYQQRDHHRDVLPLFLRSSSSFLFGVLTYLTFAPSASATLLPARLFSLASKVDSSISRFPSLNRKVSPPTHPTFAQSISRPALASLRRRLLLHFGDSSYIPSPPLHPFTSSQQTLACLRLEKGTLVLCVPTIRFCRPLQAGVRTYLLEPVSQNAI